MIDFKIQKVKVSLELHKAIKAGKKIALFQGGTGAGKTVNILKTLIGVTLQGQDARKHILSAYKDEQGNPYNGDPLQLSAVGPSYPHMRRGCIRDWQTIMDNSKLYIPQRHNKTEHVYNYPSKSYMEFFSAENEEKVRGPGRKILYVNEINLFDWETIRQLLVRTDLFMVGDYNPIDEFHWIYDELIPRDDCHFVECTFRDNPYLAKGRKDEIERNRETDPEWFQVYGEGKRGKSEGLVYKIYDHNYKDVDNYVYGVDFAFNVETGISRVGFNDNEFHFKQVFYERYHTNSMLIEWIQKNLKDWKTATFVCDNAEPDRIEEMKRAKIKAVPCDKGPGVQWVKSHKQHYDKHSPDMLKELRSYKNVKDEKRNVYTDVPVKGNDHLMDCNKYGAAYFFTPIGKTRSKAYD